ncbi:hypothetical protein V6N11_016870 [Hibiscus sabdariffa]|uniref:DC1 domain-containing protein n=1 Tax=Hibiscus sabdariffa TaxID=183260 RepID=A0ABR2TWQ7_9ROSI
MENKALSGIEMVQDEGTGVIHTEIQPIHHNHQMYEVTEELNEEKLCSGYHLKTKCTMCELPILGPAYVCPKCCDYILHESCIKLPKKIRVPFHSEHVFRLGEVKVTQLLQGEDSNPQCYGCSLSLKWSWWAYNCESCLLNLHPLCAISLRHPSPPVLLAALRAVGNMFSRDDLHTLALSCLLNLLKNNYKKSIKEEACWIISYITKGNHEHIQAVIEADIVAPLIHLLQNVVLDIKKVAARAIANATFRGTDDQIKYENDFVYYLSGIMSHTEIMDKLPHSGMSQVPCKSKLHQARFLVSQGCIKPLCDLLNCTEPTTVSFCLKGNILEAGETDEIKGVIPMHAGVERRLRN